MVDLYIKSIGYIKNWLNLIENDDIYQKRRPKLTVLAQIWPIFDKIDLFWIKIEFKIKISVRIWSMVGTIDRTGKFGSKDLIKSCFEYDLDWILDGGRSNRISLVTERERSGVRTTPDLSEVINVCPLRVGWKKVVSVKQ